MDRARVVTFDRGTFERWLNELDPRRLVAFSAACSERLFPYYEAFYAMEKWGDAQALRQALELAWAWVRGRVRDEQTYRRALERCEQAIPSSDEFSSWHASGARDAAGAVADTVLQCLEPTPRRAAEIAELVWEAVVRLEQVRLRGPVEGPYIVDIALVNHAASSPVAEAARAALEASIRDVKTLNTDKDSDVAEFRLGFGTAPRRVNPRVRSSPPLA